MNKYKEKFLELANDENLIEKTLPEINDEMMTEKIFDQFLRQNKGIQCHYCYNSCAVHDLPKLIRHQKLLRNKFLQQTEKMKFLEKEINDWIDFMLKIDILQSKGND